MLSFVILFTGCASVRSSDVTAVAISSTSGTVKGTTIEAEKGKLLGNAQTAKSARGYSGTGYVTHFQDEGDGVQFKINVKTASHYDLHFYINSNGQYKENYVVLDNQNVATVVSQTNSFEDCVVSKIWMDEGIHTLCLKKYWGWVDFDKIIISPSETLGSDFYKVDGELCNPNATEETVNLYNYLLSIWGKYTLSGQHADGVNTKEFEALQKKTGKLPAIIEIDLMDLSVSRGGGASSVDKYVKLVEDYDKKGGIVVINWHWNAPKKYLYDTNDNPWWRGFYTDASNFDIAKVMNGQDDEGLKLIMEDLDNCALVLKKLQEKKIPVLFRPLHEASGGWFWWGAKGADAYLKLYKLMYDRLVDHHGINNLIWVWNCDTVEWYPGDEYVDIASTDIYASEHEHSTQINKFIQESEACGGKKPIALAENGVQIDPDTMKRDNVYWLYFCTWGGDFVTSGKYTSDSVFKKVFNSEYVITLDELPDWKNGDF